MPYVLKTDDDMYINLKQLFQLVRIVLKNQPRLDKVSKFHLDIFNGFSSGISSFKQTRF